MNIMKGIDIAFYMALLLSVTITLAWLIGVDVQPNGAVMMCGILTIVGGLIQIKREVIART